MPLSGYIDVCTGSLIAGWVWDSDHPETRVAVEILVDGKPLAQVIAQQYREDLKKVGIGDGTYAFWYTPPSPIDFKSQKISVIVMGTDPYLLRTGAGPISRLSPSDLHRGAKAIGWFHSMDLGGGHWTDGHKTVEQMEAELGRWRFPEDLSGKTVLDIGCADGGFSVAAIRRGARSVLSIDEKMTAGMGFLLRNKVFPLEFKQIDLFSKEFMDLPTFDVIIFAGVLYHVQDPLEALKRVRSKTRELAILETHINESLGASVPYMVYYEANQLRADPTNWWGPNTLCLEAMLRTAGLQATKTFVEFESPSNGRISYLLRPAEGSVYSKVISSATGSRGVLEEYQDMVLRLDNRVRDLERQLEGLKRGNSWPIVPEEGNEPTCRSAPSAQTLSSQRDNF